MTEETYVTHVDGLSVEIDGATHSDRGSKVEGDSNQLQLERLQAMELEMFKTVQAICRKHCIPYYALGGTLLGAVRHKGFIPWDDDIDIAIPRPYYESFLKIAAKELPEHLGVADYRDRIEDMLPTLPARVYDKRTKLLKSNSMVQHNSFVLIDVFPLDAMPSNGFLRSVQKYRLLYDRMKIMFSMYEINVHQHRPNRPFHEKALMRFREVTKLGSNWDPRVLMAKADKDLCGFDYDKEGYIVNVFGAYKFKEMFPKAWFGEGVELPFEDTTITCPVDYDKVLTQMYGDYMKLPPEEDRAQHHCMTIVSLGE